MVMQAILVGLVAAFGCLDYQLGTLYAFRPIVLCPLVGIVLGDLQTGLAVGASLELLFMGSISIGAYVPPNETVGGVLACAFAISLNQGTEAAIALAMPIAILSQAIGNLLQPIWPLIVDWGEKKAGEGDLRGIRIAHWGIGLWGCLEYFLLCGGAFLLGADAVQGILDWIPSFVLDGFGIAANMLPAMGFAMLGRMILNKESMPFFFLGFLLCSYLGMPVLGVALLAIITVIEKYNLLGGGVDAQLALEEDDDDF